MVCPRCHSQNVHTQIVTDIRTKYRGCLGWFLWILLAICTCGLILIIPAITNDKTKTKHKTVAICQNCGKKWRI